MSTPEKRAAEQRGRRAVFICALYLLTTGWRILERRFKSQRGTGAGEVDIIAKRGNVLAFIEVKARADETSARESVTPMQQARITRAAEAFLQRRPYLSECEIRFDLMTVGASLWPKRIADAWRP
jgi:putative endonuclease